MLVNKQQAISSQTNDFHQPKALHAIKRLYVDNHIFLHF
jgi:hypothetical protein